MSVCVFVCVFVLRGRMCEEGVMFCHHCGRDMKCQSKAVGDMSPTVTTHKHTLTHS